MLPGSCAWLIFRCRREVILCYKEKSCNLFRVTLRMCGVYMAVGIAHARYEVLCDVETGVE